MPPHPEASERITRRLFAFLADLHRDLREAGDREGLEALPPVLLTTGVIAMSQGLTPDTVAEVLETLKVRVERGDFSGLSLPTGDAAV